MNSNDIFISYAREDRPRVEKLAAALESSGWQVWWDPELRGGQHFPEVIERALAAARCVITVWSRESVDSRWVRAEATAAMEGEKLLPVLIDDVLPPIEFRQFQTVSLVDWIAGGSSRDIETLTADVAAILGEETPEMQAAAPPTPSKRRLWIPLLIVVAAALGGVAFWHYPFHQPPDSAAVVQALLSNYGAEGDASLAPGQADSGLPTVLRQSVDTLQVWAAAPSTSADLDQAIRDLATGNVESTEAWLEAEQKRLQAAEGTDRRRPAKMARIRGALAQLHDNEMALRAYLEAVELDAESPQGWDRLGQLLARLGALPEGSEPFQETVEIHEGRVSRSVQALGYEVLGNDLEIGGDLEAAEIAYRRALDIERGSGSEAGEADGYANLGNLYLARGDLDVAEAVFEQALTIYRDQDLQGGVIGTYASLGNVYLIRGDETRAENMYRRSLTISEALDHRESMARAYGNLGIIHQRRGELEQAVAMHRKSLDIEEALGHVSNMADDYANLANIHLAKGDLDQAEAMARKALEAESSMGRTLGIAESYSRLGVIHSSRGELDEAEKMHRKALELDQRMGNKLGIARDYTNLAVVDSGRGDAAAAEEKYNQALAIYREAGAREEIEQIEAWLAEIKASEVQ